MAVAFLAGTYKLHFRAAPFHLCRAEVLEHREVCLAAQVLGERFGHGNAAAHHHHVDVVRVAFQEEVAHVAPHEVALHAQFIGRFRDMVEDVLVYLLLDFFLVKELHA